MSIIDDFPGVPEELKIDNFCLAVFGKKVDTSDMNYIQVLLDSAYMWGYVDGYWDGLKIGMVDGVKKIDALDLDDEITLDLNDLKCLNPLGTSGPGRTFYGKDELEDILKSWDNE